MVRNADICSGVRRSRLNHWACIPHPILLLALPDLDALQAHHLADTWQLIIIPIPYDLPQVLIRDAQPARCEHG